MDKQIKVSEIKVLKCSQCGGNLIYKDKHMVCPSFQCVDLTNIEDKKVKEYEPIH